MRTGPSSPAASPRSLVAVVGPTCTGKTRLAVTLAERLQPAELINADSRQLRRGLVVATCTPTASELGPIRCHMLAQADPGDDYTVAHWLASATAAVDEMAPRGVLPIVVGGTGLYVTALVDGYNLAGAPPDPRMRAERSRLATNEEGRHTLAAEVVRRDPGSAATLDLRNPRRVIRALEILDAHGRLEGARRTRPRPAVLLGLDLPRALHEEWVRARTTGMFCSGALTDEVHAALQRGVSREALSTSGIGYTEALALLDGALDVNQAVEAAVRRTQRYAQAQRRYLRRDPRIRWLDASADPAAILQQALGVIAAADGAPGPG